jgi:hypothetical protein
MNFWNGHITSIVNVEEQAEYEPEWKQVACQMFEFRRTTRRYIPDERILSAIFTVSNILP